MFVIDTQEKLAAFGAIMFLIGVAFGALVW